MEAVAVIRAGGIVAGRYRDTFVGRIARARKLADEPAVGKLVVKHDGVTVAVGLADSAEAIPDARNRSGSEQRRSGVLVEDLIPFVDDLHVLSLPDFAVGVGRGAIADHAWERYTIEVEDRRGHGKR